MIINLTNTYLNMVCGGGVCICLAPDASQKVEIGGVGFEGVAFQYDLMTQCKRMCCGVLKGVTNWYFNSIGHYCLDGYKITIIDDFSVKFYGIL